jgi:hypothetical protein
MTALKENYHSNISLDEAEKLDPRLTDDNLVYQTADGEKVKFSEINV